MLASPVLQPAAIKHTATRPFLRETETGEEMSGAEQHRGEEGGGGGKCSRA